MPQQEGALRRLDDDNNDDGSPIWIRASTSQRQRVEAAATNGVRGTHWTIIIGPDGWWRPIIKKLGLLVYWRTSFSAFKMRLPTFLITPPRQNNAARV
jgi:hypothetical protein